MTYDIMSMTKCLYDTMTYSGILLTKNIQLNKLSTFTHTKYDSKQIIYIRKLNKCLTKLKLKL